jgi:hypothetical protein
MLPFFIGTIQVVINYWGSALYKNHKCIQIILEVPLRLCLMPTNRLHLIHNNNNIRSLDINTCQ